MRREHRARARPGSIVAVWIVLAILIAMAGGAWLALGAPTASASGLTGDAGTGSSFIVTASDSLSFSASTVQVDPNGTGMVSVTFINAGSLTHTFTLSPVHNWTIPSSYAANLSVWFQQHPPIVSISMSSTGTHAAVSFLAPPTGWYEFVCLTPGHFQNGMKSAIGFGVPAPPNLTGSTALQVGWPVYVIAGTIVGLVVLALALGFLSGKRKGSKYEMPPERLGYPEPATPSAPGGPEPLPPPPP